jgi:hypothetical protein
LDISYWLRGSRWAERLRTLSARTAVGGVRWETGSGGRWGNVLVVEAARTATMQGSNMRVSVG